MKDKSLILPRTIQKLTGLSVARSLTPKFGDKPGNLGGRVLGTRSSFCQKKLLKPLPSAFYLMLMVWCPDVLATSMPIEGLDHKLADRSISSLPSPIDFLTQRLKSFGDTGKNDADGNRGTGTYAQDLGFPDDGQTGSGDRVAGGNRGNCPKVDVPLTALIPATNLGKTVDGKPIFWFYIPYEMKYIRQATFSLLEENQNPVLSEPISIALSGTPGLIGVTLPTTVNELEIDREYHWFLEIECNAENSSQNLSQDSLNNPYVHGWVKRVAPIPGIAPNDYRAYAEQGIWYNVLTPLAQMRQQDPQNPTLQRDWEALLKSVELESLTDVSLVNCCIDRDELQITIEGRQKHFENGSN